MKFLASTGLFLVWQPHVSAVRKNKFDEKLQNRQVDGTMSVIFDEEAPVELMKHEPTPQCIDQGDSQYYCSKWCGAYAGCGIIDIQDKKKCDCAGCGNCTARIPDPTPAPTPEPTPPPTPEPTPAPTPYCMKVQTGTAVYNDGSLEVRIDTGNGLVVADSKHHYAFGEMVLEKCYATQVAGVQVMNPTSNAWAGSIQYSVDGGSRYGPMVCTSCTVGSNTAQIVVDGNADSTQLAETRCLSGASCAIQVRPSGAGEKR